MRPKIGNERAGDSRLLLRVSCCPFLLGSCCPLPWALRYLPGFDRQPRGAASPPPSESVASKGKENNRKENVPRAYCEVLANSRERELSRERIFESQSFSRFSYVSSCGTPKVLIRERITHMVNSPGRARGVKTLGIYTTLAEQQVHV